MESLKEQDQSIEWSLRSLAEKQFTTGQPITTAGPLLIDYHLDIPNQSGLAESRQTDLTSSLQGEEARPDEERGPVAGEGPVANPYLNAASHGLASTSDGMRKSQKTTSRPLQPPPPRNPALPPIDDEFQLSPLTTAAEVLAKDDFKKLEQLIEKYRGKQENK